MFSKNRGGQKVIINYFYFAYLPVQNVPVYIVFQMHFTITLMFK